MTERQDLLLQDHVGVIKNGEALTKDYFYVPHIYYEDDEYLEPHSLLFEQNGSWLDDLYASKVKAGETLWQAVRRDMDQDFHYPTDMPIMIDSVHLRDTAVNRQGIRLGRVDVCVVVSRFDVKNIHPIGLNMKWEEDE